MGLPKALVAAFLPTLLLAGHAQASSRQASVGHDHRSVKATNRSSKVMTFNFGAGSAEANEVISQGYRSGDTVYISGQYSRDMKGEFVGVGDFDKQARKALENVDAVLAGFKLNRSNIAEMVVYLTDPRSQSQRLIPIMQEYLRDHRPAATVLGTTGLFYPEQLIEIRVVAHTN